MIEIVAYRSPESNVLMNRIQETVLELNIKSRLQALLHWGLENQLMTAADLAHTPLNDLIRPNSTFSRVEAFRAVRKFLKHGNPPVFDNHFVQRLQL